MRGLTVQATWIAMELSSLPGPGESIDRVGTDSGMGEEAELRDAGPSTVTEYQHICLVEHGLSLGEA